MLIAKGIPTYSLQSGMWQVDIFRQVTCAFQYLFTMASLYTTSTRTRYGEQYYLVP